MWKSSPARNCVTTCRNLVEDSRGVRWVERNIWPRTLMLSSQWKKWCKQQKMVVVDNAEMKECASAFIGVSRDESRMAERVGNCVISSNIPVRSRRKICRWLNSRVKSINRSWRQWWQLACFQVQTQYSWAHCLQFLHFYVSKFLCFCHRTEIRTGNKEYLVYATSLSPFFNGRGRSSPITTYSDY